jgi:hypothetical protein
VIVRILGEGQLRVDDAHLAELNALDDALIDAVDAGDEPRFASALARLVDRFRALGTPVPAEHLGGSDVVLPEPGTSLPEVRALLGDEGLVPG